MTKKVLYINLCIIVARAWERIRVSQPYQEMPLDNVESIDAIAEIATNLIKLPIVKEYLRTEDKTTFSFIDRVGTMFDTYFELKATKVIYKEYL